MERVATPTSILSRDWIVFAIAFTVVVLDQVSKALIRMSLTPGQSVPEDSPIRFSYYTNTGAAFSLFPNQTIVFIVIAIAAIGIIVFYSRKLPKDSSLIRLGLGLQLGGAIGNLIDRLVFGQVTDFIDVTIWPVFNLADSSIVIGVCLLAYFLLFTSPSEPEPVKTDVPEKSQE